MEKWNEFGAGKKDNSSEGSNSGSGTNRFVAALYERLAIRVLPRRDVTKKMARQAKKQSSWFLQEHSSNQVNEYIEWVREKIARKAREERYSNNDRNAEETESECMKLEASFIVKGRY